MPDTKCYEDFEGFVLTSLSEHLEKTKGQETVFLKELLRLSAYVRGEARRNHEGYLNSGEDSTRFFYDLSKKVQFLV